MCGIFAHIGGPDSKKECLQGLYFLEYRGYDSSGVAGIENGELFCYKEKGKISDLEKLLENKLHKFQLAIGHTRWATHGAPTQINAHPQLDQNKSIAVVHNGILENHRSLRLMLEKQGVAFTSETDTEVITQLIAHLYKGNLVEAVQKALTLMKGFWALSIIHKDHPDQLIATCRENPLIIGKKKGEAFISSDPYAFKGRKLDLYVLNNDEVALVTKDKLKIFDKNQTLIEKLPEAIDLPEVEISKGNYPHFMLKEIEEQREALKSAMQGRFLLDEGNASFEHFSLTKKEFQSLKKIVIIGCGTSWHAALIASLQIEEWTKLPCIAEIASEFRYKETHIDEYTLVIALSQSGETFDTIAAARKCKEKGAKLLAICNVPGSTLMRLAPSNILLRAGPEISVCSTKAFNCQLIVLSLVSLKLARLGGLEKEIGQDFLFELIKIPELISTVLEKSREIKALAKKYASYSNFFFLGRQYMFPTSLEAALKLKEISYLNATSYPAGELKHGPIALIDEKSVIVGLLGNEKTYEKMLSNLQEVKARGGKVLAFAPMGAVDVGEIADDVIDLLDTLDFLAPILYSVSLQLFAYHMANTLSLPIDQPRNLAKSVTVE